MKRSIFAVLCLLSIILASCSVQGAFKTIDAGGKTGSNGPGSSTTNSSNTEAGGQTGKIVSVAVESPMTLSDNPVEYGGKPCFLRLKLVKGRYYEDWNPGAYMGTNWEGSFAFELQDEGGSTLARTDLNGIYTGPLSFGGSFKLDFEDYNNDGLPDFTLGQYASSNGREYRLFTLGSDGRVMELPIKGGKALFISDYTGAWSTRLTRTGNGSFTVKYYDNSKQKTYVELYKWEEGSFRQVETQESPGRAAFDSMLAKDTVKVEMVIKYMKENLPKVTGEDASYMLTRLEELQKKELPVISEKFGDQSLVKKLESVYTPAFDLNSAVGTGDETGDGTGNGTGDGTGDAGKVEDAGRVKDAGLRSLLLEIRDGGYGIDMAEGMFYPIIDYSAYKSFRPYVTDDMKAYIDLMSVESAKAPCKDGAVVISRDEVLARALNQEKFISDYSGSLKFNDVWKLYSQYLLYVFYGADNTPAFSYESKVIDPSLKEGYLDIAGEYEAAGGNYKDSRLAKALAGYVEVLGRNGWRLTGEVDQFRKKASEEIS